jgi:hypothetical protein
MAESGGFDDREILLGPGLVPLPERLLLAHAQGEVLFLTGAGSSQSANLPSFRELVVQVFERLDTSTHEVMKEIPQEACNQWQPRFAHLTPPQQAEVLRFVDGDYDVVLGMLERRLDEPSPGSSRVRQVVAELLGQRHLKPAPIHKALVKLGDLGTSTTIVTTNFDTLLEKAAANLRRRVRSHSLAAVPRPGRTPDFDGVLHIHGAIARNSRELSDFIVTDRDFGEFYLRRRVVPDFIYDAARLFNLVLVGYSANDAPMRYLLNAVAADGIRFSDLKERFAFVSTNSGSSAIVKEDWRGRGITPILYDSSSGHQALTDTLVGWAQLLPAVPNQSRIDSKLKTLVKTSRATAKDHDRDLFDHILRRSSSDERTRIASVLSKVGANVEWLTAINAIEKERRLGQP